MSKFVLTTELNIQAPNLSNVVSQMNKQLSNVNINLNAPNAPQVNKQLSNTNKNLKQTVKSTKQAAQGFDRLGASIGKSIGYLIRYDIARKAINLFSNAIEQGLSDAIKFEREMVKIAQVTGKTASQLKGLEREISNLSTSMGVSSMSLLKASRILAQTGMEADKVTLALDALAKTTLAPTFDNLTDTTETAIAAMRQFRLEAGDLDRVLGGINKVAGSFAVEAGDIGVAIRRAGGAFRSAGGQIEELIALFTAVRSTTRESAETIATGFRTIFTRLQRPTTLKFLQQFGVQLQDLEGKFVGPFEAVRRLNVALKNLDPRDVRYSRIIEQLGGFRQVSKVIPLIQEFETAQKALNVAQAGSGSLAVDAAKAQDTFAVKIDKLKEEVKELFRVITESTAFKVMLDGAIAITKAITNLATALGPIIPMLTAMFAIKGLGALGSLASGVGKGFKSGRGYARGGIVPGSGTGDTVPAMLTPGEFVIRKSAVQAFGAANLAGINKYASGGPVAASQIQSGGFSSVARRVIVNPHISKLRKDPSIPLTKDNYYNPSDTFELSNYTTEKVRYGKYYETGPDGKKRHAGYEVKSRGNPKGRRYPTGSSQGLAINNHLRIKDGDSWEDMLVALGYMSQPPNGFYGGKKPFDGIGPGGNIIEARSRDRQTSIAAIMDKAIRHAEMTEIAVASRLTAGKNDIGIPFKVRKYEDARKLAKGGKLTAQGTDSIPALLTPGEFVINRKSAQSIGYDKLHGINKFAKGGVVGGIAGRRQKMFMGGDPMGMIMGMMMGGGMGGGGGEGGTKDAAKAVRELGKESINTAKGFQQLKGNFGVVASSFGELASKSVFAYGKVQAFGVMLEQGLGYMGLQNETISKVIQGLTDFTSWVYTAGVALQTLRATGMGDALSNLFSQLGGTKIVNIVQKGFSMLWAGVTAAGGAVGTRVLGKERAGKVAEFGRKKFGQVKDQFKRVGQFTEGGRASAEFKKAGVQPQYAERVAGATQDVAQKELDKLEKARSTAAQGFEETSRVQKQSAKRVKELHKSIHEMDSEYRKNSKAIRRSHQVTSNINNKNSKFGKALDSANTNLKKSTARSFELGRRYDEQVKVVETNRNALKAQANSTSEMVESARNRIKTNDDVIKANKEAAKNIRSRIDVMAEANDAGGRTRWTSESSARAGRGKPGQMMSNYDMAEFNIDPQSGKSMNQLNKELKTLAAESEDLAMKNSGARMEIDRLNTTLDNAQYTADNSVKKLEKLEVAREAEIKNGNKIQSSIDDINSARQTELDKVEKTRAKLEARQTDLRKEGAKARAEKITQIDTNERATERSKKFDKQLKRIDGSGQIGRQKAIVQESGETIARAQSAGKFDNTIKGIGEGISKAGKTASAAITNSVQPLTQMKGLKNASRAVNVIGSTGKGLANLAKSIGVVGVAAIGAELALGAWKNSIQESVDKQIESGATWDEVSAEVHKLGAVAGGEAAAMGVGMAQLGGYIATTAASLAGVNIAPVVGQIGYAAAVIGTTIYAIGTYADTVNDMALQVGRAGLSSAMQKNQASMDAFSKGLISASAASHTTTAALDALDTSADAIGAASKTGGLAGGMLGDWDPTAGMFFWGADNDKIAAAEAEYFAAQEQLAAQIPAIFAGLQSEALSNLGAIDLDKDAAVAGEQLATASKDVVNNMVARVGGEEKLKQLALAAGLSSEELKRQWQSNAEIQIRVNAAQAKAEAAALKLATATQAAVDVMMGLKSLDPVLNTLSARFSNIAGIASGGVTASTGGSIAGQFSTEAISAISTSDQWQKLEDNAMMVANSLGEAGGLIVQNFIGSAKLMKELPDATAELKNNINTLDLDSETASGRLTAILEERLGSEEWESIPQTIRDRLAGGIDAAAATGDFGEAFDQNLQGLLDDMNESNSMFQKSMQEAAASFDKYNVMLGNALAERSQMEMNYISGLQKLQSMRFDRKKMVADARGQTLGASDYASEFRSQQAIQLRGVKGSSGQAAAGMSVSELSKLYDNQIHALHKSNQELEDLQESAKGANKENEEYAKKVAEARESNAKLKQETDQTRKALESYTNVQQRLTGLQNDLAKEQEGRKARRGVLTDFAFASDEDRSSQVSGMRTALGAISAGNMDAVGSEDRAAVGQFLDRFENVNLAAFGGKTGGELKKEFEIQELEKVMGRDLTDDEKKSIMESTSKEDKLIAEMERIAQEGETAQQALLDGQKTNIEEMTSAIQALNQTFLSDLKKILAEREMNRMKSDLRKSQAGEESAAKKLEAGNTILAKVFGDELKNMTQEQKDQALKTISANASAMQAAAEAAPNAASLAGAASMFSETGAAQYEQAHGKWYDQGIATGTGDFNQGPFWKMAQAAKTAAGTGDTDDTIADATKMSQAVGAMIRTGEGMVDVGAQDEFMAAASEFKKFTDRLGQGGEDMSIEDALEGVEAGPAIKAALQQAFAGAGYDMNESGDFMESDAEYLATAFNDYMRASLASASASASSASAGALSGFAGTGIDGAAVMAAFGTGGGEFGDALSTLGGPTTLSALENASQGAADETARLEKNIEALNNKLEGSDKPKKTAAQAVEDALNDPDFVAHLMSNPSPSNPYKPVGAATGGLISGTGRGVLYRAGGGFIPRGTDTVPAMLTPGEFVIRRKAVKAVGLPLLQRINNAGKGRGGKRGYYNNGGVVTDGLSMDFGRLDKAMNRFSRHIDKMSQALANGFSVNVGGEITVNVRLNGAEMLEGAKGALGQLAHDKVTEGITNMLRQHFPQINSGGKGIPGKKSSEYTLQQANDDLLSGNYKNMPLRKNS